MALTNEEIAHVAHLARLRLTPEEVEKMREQLSNILEYMAMLEEVDTSDVPPTAQVTGLANVFRPDQVQESLSRDLALSNAPAQAEGMFRVQPIFDE